MFGKLLLNLRQDHRRRAHSDVDPQLAKDQFVFRIIDPRDDALHVELVPSDLAGDEVVFVIPCHGDEEIGSPAPCSLLNRGLAAVASHRDLAQRFGDLGSLGSIPFNHKRLMARLHQLLRQVEADLPTTNDDDVHLDP